MFFYIFDLNLKGKKRGAILVSIPLVSMGKPIEEKGVKPFRFFSLLTIRL